MPVNFNLLMNELPKLASEYQLELMMYNLSFNLTQVIQSQSLSHLVTCLSPYLPGRMKTEGNNKGRLTLQYFTAVGISVEGIASSDVWPHHTIYNLLPYAISVM